MLTGFKAPNSSSTNIFGNSNASSEEVFLTVLSIPPPAAAAAINFSKNHLVSSRISELEKLTVG